MTTDTSVTFEQQAGHTYRIGMGPEGWQVRDITPTWPAMTLTTVDLTMLQNWFAHAHHHGKLSDADHDRTVVVLTAAAHRLRQRERELAERSMG